MLINSFIGLQAQEDQETYNDIEDFYEIFDGIVDCPEGHSLVNLKGNSINMAMAEIRLNTDIRSFKQALEDFSYAYLSDSILQQMYKLEENKDSLILYCEAVSYRGIDEATGEWIDINIESIPYSNDTLLKHYILMQEELRFFYEASAPTLFLNYLDEGGCYSLNDIKEEVKRSMDSLQVPTGKWTVDFDNGQLAARGKFLPFVIVNYECITAMGDEYHQWLTLENIYIKDGLWQTYKPNGELFRILNYNKGELIECFELIDGKLEKLIESENEWNKKNQSFN
jgi:hypothetical protein